MIKLIIISAAIILILAVSFIFFISSGPNLKKYEHLGQPEISTMNRQKMIEVTLKGDPGVTAGKAIGQLFTTFYHLKNNRVKQSAPRARWPVSFDQDRGTWLGIYALPVSDNVTELPKQKNGIKVKLTTWEYGTIAQILHIGPYTEETPTIEKLIQFIIDNGYEITGDHEEEYLKGPGLWPTDPQKYYTVIRYRVRQK